VNSRVSMLTNSLNRLPANRAIRLDNRSCPYCGTPSETLSTRDHVIGRRFVPKGSLNGDWNLIVRACDPCNGRKSDLEDDISAITMQPNALGRFATEDAFLKEESERKAADSISRRTKKTVAESVESLSIHFPVQPGVRFSFTGRASPQIDEMRAFQLARLQTMAFFYFVTHNRDTKLGGFWPGSFYPLCAVHRSDWGNPLLMAFTGSVENWEPRFIGVSAKGYYKVAIRRHPNAVAWSSALEWNQSYRVVGFFGDWEPVQSLVDNFPSLATTAVTGRAGDGLAIRLEVPLVNSASDTLFRGLEDDDEAAGSVGDRNDEGTT
jgi:hypothetical protein